MRRARISDRKQGNRRDEREREGEEEQKMKMVMKMS